MKTAMDESVFDSLIHKAVVAVVSTFVSTTYKGPKAVQR